MTSILPSSTNKNMEKKDRKDLENQKPEKIRLTEENLKVTKKKIETGRIKISKKVLEEEVPVDLSGFEEEIKIERKKIDRVVEKPGPAVRKEGDSTVYSLYREVFIKQTIFDEEVWISKTQTPTSNKRKEKVRKEILEIERTPGQSVEKG